MQGETYTSFVNTSDRAHTLSIFIFDSAVLNFYNNRDQCTSFLSSLSFFKLTMASVIFVHFFVNLLFIFYLVL